MAEAKETITNYHRHGWSVRVWRDFPLDRPQMAPHEIQMEKQDVTRIVLENHGDMNLLAEDILKLDRVSAVEVKAVVSGDGIVLYKEWP